MAPANIASADTAPIDHWQLARRRIVFGRRPMLMGIVNVTPDSFSDGGRYFEPAAATEHARRLVAQGAAILDVGGESTRPGAPPVEADEEIRRVVPVIRAIVDDPDLNVPISADTSKAAVAREALQAGAEAINDVTALTGDRAMPAVVAESGCGVCLMHMRGTPRTMQVDPRYDDVTAEVLEYLRVRRDAAEAAGIERHHIAVDPGIGFGKTLEHNLTLLRDAERFHELGCPVLYGPSRKRFIAAVLEDAVLDDAVLDDAKRDRCPGTIGVALALAMRRVQVIRVHDAGPVADALRLFEAAGGGG